MKESIKQMVKMPIEMIFDEIEQKLISQSKGYPPFPPIFVLGVPRSGTTLMLQLMIKRYRVCYFTNFIDRFYRSPIVAGKIASYIHGCNSSTSFTSFYGRTKSWDDPYDGTKIWSRWFPCEPVYVNKGTLTHSDVEQIRSTVTFFEKIYKCPFINKAQRNNGRILELNRVFPDSLFIHVKRELSDVVRSVIKGFSDLNKKNLWFSMKPSNWRMINSNDIVEHICEEVYFTERDIKSSLAEIGSNRYIETDYSEICEAPNKVLDRVAYCYSRISNNQFLEVRASIPESFRKSKGAYCTREDVKKINDKIAMLIREDDSFRVKANPSPDGFAKTRSRAAGDDITC